MDAHEKTAIKVEVDGKLLDELEAFRKTQSRIPSRAEVLRRFLALGLANARADRHVAA
jgi:hypothetical protein